MRKGFATPMLIASLALVPPIDIGELVNDLVDDIIDEPPPEEPTPTTVEPEEPTPTTVEPEEPTPTTEAPPPPPTATTRPPTTTTPPGTTPQAQSPSATSPTSPTTQVGGRTVWRLNLGFPVPTPTTALATTGRRPTLPRGSIPAPATTAAPEETTGLAADAEPAPAPETDPPEPPRAAGDTPPDVGEQIALARSVGAIDDGTSPVQGVIRFLLATGIGALLVAFILRAARAAR